MLTWHAGVQRFRTLRAGAHCVVLLGAAPLPPLVDAPPPGATVRALAAALDVALFRHRAPLAATGACG